MSAFEWIMDLCGELWGSEDENVGRAIFELSTALGDGDLETVEAAYPTLIAFARERRMPWVELLARHMRQQAYLNFGTNAGQMLPEVVETIAMTMRDDMRDCPQSICAIQDLSICYGAIDAPGYAEARMEAIDDVLPKLDPRIECSTCLLSERTQALCSLKRYDEALDYAEAWITRAADAGVVWADEITDNETKQRDLINAAIGAGRFEQAQAWLDTMNPSMEQSPFWRGVTQARLDVARGTPEGAVAVLPPLSDARPNWITLRRFWQEAAFAMAGAGVLANDDALKAAVAEVTQACEDNGMVRDAFNGRIECGLLAAWRGDAGLAVESLGLAERLRQQLRGSHGADERLAELRAVV